MQHYGQFCSVARSLDLLGERWTLLVVRELLCGSTRFGDVRRGIPRVSKTMLSARLRALVDAGVVERGESDGAPTYALTDAGRELASIVRVLGGWGQRWLPRTLPRSDLDVDALYWDIRRRVRRDALPRAPFVVRLEATDVPARRGVRFLLLRREEVSLCTENPGFPEELAITGTLRTLTGWWRGDLSLSAARAEGMTTTGRGRRVRAVGEIFERYLFSDVPPAASAIAGTESGPRSSSSRARRARSAS
jgi:DNA-binding HxlR family transcriptional regulator